MHRLQRVFLLAALTYGGCTSEETKSLINQANHLAQDAVAHYHSAKRVGTCQEATIAALRHQQIENAFNSIVIEKRVYSRSSAVADAFNKAAPKIDEVKTLVEEFKKSCTP